MVAGLQAGHQRQGDGREARRGENRAGGAGQLGPGGLQGFGRRRSLGAVGVAAAPVQQVVRRRVEHRRAAIDRRIDEAVLLGRIAAGMDEAGALAERLASLDEGLGMVMRDVEREGPRS